jgi:hypothetical protein
MSEQPTPTKGELRGQMDAGLAAFLAALDGLDADQLDGPRDAAGWTVRDHLVHLAIWAEGIAALLRREDRWAAMGLAMDNPASDDLDYDALNEAIRQQHLGMTPAEARAWVVAAHDRVASALDGPGDDELKLPYDRFVAPFTADTGHPIWGYVAGNTFDHYQEHLPWLSSIAEGRE